MRGGVKNRRQMVRIHPPAPLRMGMRLGLFSLEMPEDPPAGPCPQGPEGEPGALGS